jgi:hypothetical protein
MLWLKPFLRQRRSRSAFAIGGEDWYKFNCDSFTMAVDCAEAGKVDDRCHLATFSKSPRTTVTEPRRQSPS